MFGGMRPSLAKVDRAKQCVLENIRPANTEHSSISKTRNVTKTYVAAAAPPAPLIFLVFNNIDW